MLEYCLKNDSLIYILNYLCIEPQRYSNWKINKDMYIGE